MNKNVRDFLKKHDKHPTWLQQEAHWPHRSPEQQET